MNFKFILFFFVILYLYQNIDAQRLDTSDCKCRLPSNRRIVGGREVKQYVPWFVSLGFWSDLYGEYKHFCGGTIVNRKWILTAAHCKKIMQGPNDIKKIQVRVGMTQINDTEGVQRFGVKQFVIDSRYEKNGNPHFGDIAFIEIDGNIQFSEKIAPACFPRDDKYENYGDKVGSLHAVGLGVTNSYLLNKRNGERSKIHLANRLKEAFFNDISSQTSLCYKHLICVKQVKYPDSTCSGDSGSGLMHHKNGSRKIVVIGVNSFGFSNDEGDYYRLCVGMSGFSRISTYIELFKKQVERDFCVLSI